MYTKEDVEKINSCPFLRDREGQNFHQILDLLPKNAKVLEIGSFKGWTSILMVYIRKDLNVITIDPHYGIPSHPELSSSEVEVNKNIASYKFTDKITHIKVSSQDFFTDEKFDMIFIDGDHTFEGVKFDYDKFKNNLKEKGIMVFHDYGCHPGVTVLCNMIIADNIFKNYLRINSMLAFKKC